MSALFDHIGDQFLAYYDSTQGAVRGEVVRRNLESYLGNRRLNVLDVGCGEGRDALWLTKRGHTVTAIDPSASMLAAARLAAKGLSRTERVRLRFLECDDEHAVRLLDSHSFDLVLCHGVIMYQDNAQRFVANISRLVAQGGTLSLVAKNAEALAYRSAAEGHFSEARQLIENKARSVGRLGVETSAHTVEALTSLLAKHRLSTVEWFGVKVFSDSLTGPVEWTSLDELIALEAAASRIDPYRRSARLLHMIARRNA
jgi:S-adenosylmethionine-dependent methyltransferase